MDKGIVRQIVNTIATIAVIVVNTLANALPINGQTTGDISNRYTIYFVPAGYVFSIWGLIYLLLIAFTVYQALPAQREKPFQDQIGYLYALGCAANVAWIFLWHYEVLPMTLTAMAVLLLSLIAIYLRLDIGRAEVGPARRWLVHLPFSVYLGWITVATVANVSTVLYAANWGGWGIAPQVWAAIMLVVASVLGLLMAIIRADAAYLLVLVWAFVGIALKHSATPMVATGSWVSAGIATVLAILSVLPGGPLPIYRKAS
ncbi:MAG: tryptophan-rich sensory protein [Anaerolineae bacterium]|nr:tryptophan-rich sensory protein [Anaerolineae bacterium]